MAAPGAGATGGAGATELFAGTAREDRLVVFSSARPGDVDAARVRGLAAGDLEDGGVRGGRPIGGPRRIQTLATLGRTR